MKKTRVPGLVLLLLVLAAGPTAADQAKTSAKALLTEGSRLYQEGQAGEALIKFEKAIAEGATPTGEVFYQMGVAYKSVRDDATASREAMQKAVPLFEADITASRGGIAPYYYLSTIYGYELNQPAKARETALAGTTWAASDSFEAAGAEQYYQVATLHQIAGQPKAARPWFEKTVAVLESETPVNTRLLRSAIENLARDSLAAGDPKEASRWYERLLAAGPVSDEDRMTAANAMIRAGEYEAAVDTLRGVTSEPAFTEASYISRVVGRYAALGAPPIPSATEKLDDAALADAIMTSARKLAELRQKEAEREKQNPPETPETEYRTIKTKSGKTIKVPVRTDAPEPGFTPKDPNHPTPDERLKSLGIVIRPNPPAPPLSPERVAAEKEFYGLLLEYMRRGGPVRDYAVSNGLTALIFR